MFNDLREYIAQVQALGEYRLVEGADWDLEIGAVTDWQAETGNSPLLMFDNIKSYKPGYRVATNLYNTPARVALALGLPKGLTGLEQVKAWREKVKKQSGLLPPMEVEDAPIKENVHGGDEVDLFEFPVPRWHELDGGRYIGTGCLVIIRDPDEGWVNIGTYRVQAYDKNTVGIGIAPGHHGRIIVEKYWAKGKSCPVSIVCGGITPMLYVAAAESIPWGISEYDYAGKLEGAPIKVTRGVTTDLPVPATSEIVLEGEILPPEVETRAEGPFGEWTGYYAGGKTERAVTRIKSVMHRDDPVIYGAPPSRFYFHQLAIHITRSAEVWNELDSKIPGVTGVWAIGNTILIIAVKQMYGGHARQVALAAASGAASAKDLTFLITVDDDIDPSNIDQVLWALSQRCDTDTAVDVIKGMWTTKLKPSLSPDKRRNEDYTQGLVIINGCKPYYWIKDFPKEVSVSPGLLKRVKEKWGKLI